MARERLDWHGEKVLRALDAKWGKSLDDIGFSMEDEIKNSFGPKGSSPGSPPGVDHGRLKSSITTEREGLVMRIGSTLKAMFGKTYALYLEIGTTRMEARPYLKPVWLRWLPKIKEKLKIR